MDESRWRWDVGLWVGGGGEAVRRRRRRWGERWAFGGWIRLFGEKTGTNLFNILRKWWSSPFDVS